MTVVGVGPPSFNGGYGPAAGDLWLSISSMDDLGGPAWSLERRQDHPFRVIARLAPGVPVEDVALGMDRLADRLAAEYPDLNRSRRIHVLPVSRVGAEDEAEFVPGALLLMGVVGLVLVISAINLANLLIVRASSRNRELAVRLALGGSRSSLMRLSFSETLILTAAGGAAGYGLARLLLEVLGRTQLEFGVPLTLDVRMDLWVLLFALVLSATTVLMAGILPALHAGRVPVASALNDRIGGSLRRRRGATGSLVAAQLGASVVLVFTAGLFIRLC